MALFWHQFKAERGSLVGWSLMLAGLAFWIVTLFPAASQVEGWERVTEMLPPSLQGMVGRLIDFSTLKGWLQVNIFGWLPALLAYYAVAFAAGMVTREVDRGTAEFLLALPVARWRIVLSRVLAFVLHLGMVHLALYLAIWAGAAYRGIEMEHAAFVRVVTLSYALMLSLGMLALFLSIFFSDYTRAVLAGMAVSLGLYFVNMGLRGAGKGEAFVRWILYGRYDFEAALWRARFPWGDVAVLLGYAAVFLLLAMVIFERREICG